MKILFCIDHLRGDGTQHVLEQLTCGLIERRHQVTILCLNNVVDAKLYARLQTVAREVRIVGKRAIFGGYGWLSTLNWMHRQQFDVVVTMLFASDVLGRFLAHSAGVPRIVSSVRARNKNYHFYQYWLVRTTMRWVHTVVVNSDKIRHYAIVAEGVDPHKIVHIPNGINVADYANHMHRSVLIDLCHLDHNATIIGSIGRLSRQKGFDILLQAVHQLDRKTVHVLIIGNGREEAHLRSLAHSLRISRQIHFAGYRYDVPQLLGALDLYVHPARFEGMPNALLEAMAAGVPIVATAVDGSNELIEDGLHGWLVRPEDPAALASALAAALDDRDEAARRATAARQRIQTQYGLANMVQAWEEVLGGTP
jgi:glycosyltransferase involved in cell wall biosynthesis